MGESIENNFFNFKLQPSVMPNCQKVSDEERQFWLFFLELYQRQVQSLAFGSEGDPHDGKRLRKHWEELKAGGSITPQSLEELWCEILETNPGEEWDDYSKMLEDLHNPHRGVDKPRKYISLSWRLEDLAVEPYAALKSWSDAYHLLLNALNRKSDEHKRVLPKSFMAFHESSIYMLCTFINNGWKTGRNPWRTADILTEVFYREVSAWYFLMQVYPPTVNTKGNVLEGIQDGSKLSLYDPLHGEKRNWEKKSPLSREELSFLFRKHIKETEADDTAINMLAQKVLSTSGSMAKCNYLFPFVCAKLFSQLFLERSHTGEELEYYVNEYLINYETSDRLVRIHHETEGSRADRKGSRKRLVNFMKDIVSEVYQKDIRSSHLKPYEIRGRVDANWLALFHYGRGRYQFSEDLCSDVCDLSLPSLMFALFRDKEEQSRIIPDLGWLKELAGLSNFKLKKKTKKAITNAKLPDPFMLDYAEEESWRLQLGRYIFDSSAWNTNGLAVKSEKYQSEITLLENLSQTLHCILEENGEELSLVGDTTRYICFQVLFGDIVLDLRDYMCSLTYLENIMIHVSLLEQQEHLIREFVDAVVKEKSISTGGFSP